MPPENFKLSDSKFYIDGKEVPCEIVSIETIDSSENDIDDFGLHFNPEKETSLTFELSNINDVAMLQLAGVWDILKWYQKLWIKTKCVFKNIRKYKEK
jgi:hypothetical protein